MSSVVLMVGQCGNQIGHDLMKLIDSNTDTHPLTHRDGKVRCVCVDSEPKVINTNIADDTRRGQFYRGSNVVVGQRGRGNNWALGYHGLGQETRETSLLYRSMDALRKEVERCDRFAGTMVIHSLTGGTGSGLGSRLLEVVRDTYPLAHAMSVAIAPHVSGDSPLQHYNSLLSLASLQRNADGVLLFSNDDVLHHLVARPGKMAKSTLSVSMKEMNQYIATSLAGVILPLENKPKKFTKVRTEEKKNNPKLRLAGSVRERKSSHWSSLRGADCSVLDRSVMSDSMNAHDVRATFTQSSKSYIAEDCSTDDLLSPASDSSLSVMSKQPRRSSSALLRYRGLAVQTPETPTSSDASHHLSGPCGGATSGNELWDMLTAVCPEPSKKFATVHHITKPKVSWDSLGQSLIHSIRQCDRNGVMFSTLGALLVARGDTELSFPQYATKIEERLKSSLRCVNWNPFPVDFWISQYSGAGSPGAQSLTLCQNSTRITDTVENVLRKAKVMYDSGAYLHWFWKHGCTQDDFSDAFYTLESVVEEYRLAAA